MSGDPFYASPEWRRLRAVVIAEQPVCAVPGCGQRTTHVDHRIAIAAGGARLDRRNLIGYCTPHHSAKTAQVDGGFGNTRRKPSEVKLRVIGCDAAGNPLDPQHRWNRRDRK